MVIRAELFQPGMQLVEPAFFNQMTTLHGLVMVFGAIMPSFVGLANWMIPMMIGAPDMALPRMNNWSFWILPPAFLMLASTLFMEGGAPAFGWTFYAPLSTTYAAPSVTFFIFAIHILGLSSIMGSINIIATVMNMRAPGMTYMKMPLFVWTWLITAFLLVAVMPVLAGAVTMMLMDIHFGTSFFSAAGGGDPVLFQHIFWFFGHPEVYIIILPAFGVVSQIIPAFSRKPLFGYDSMVYATAAIAFLSFIVWAHHMYTVGMPVAGELFFMYATMLIAVPTGVKVFNWIDHVEGRAVLRDADAVLHRFPGAVHDRRLHGSDAVHRPGGFPVPRQLLRGGALPLRDGRRRRVLDDRCGLLLAAEVVRAICTTRPWARPTSGSRSSASTSRSSRSTSWGSPACRGASRITPCSSRTST
jgi:heme/copper-type cytochrome/quinol oxidase subunit 1